MEVAGHCAVVREELGVDPREGQAVLAFFGELARATRQAAERELARWRATVEQERAELSRRLALTQAVCERACAEVREYEGKVRELEATLAALEATNTLLRRRAADAQAEAEASRRRIAGGSPTERDDSAEDQSHPGSGREPLEQQLSAIRAEQETDLERAVPLVGCAGETFVPAYEQASNSLLGAVRVSLGRLRRPTQEGAAAWSLAPMQGRGPQVATL